MKIPDMAEIRVGIYYTKRCLLIDEMLWKYVSKFGHHSIGGKYFCIDFKYNNFVFNMEFASSEDKFVYKITPKEFLAHIKFFVEELFRWNV